MRTIKTILVSFLVMCFLAEDTVALIAYRENTFCSFGDMDMEDSSESKEKDGEEKKDEYKMNHYIPHSLYDNACESKFRFSEERIYIEHFLEINSPPPDLA